MKQLVLLAVLVMVAQAVFAGEKVVIDNKGGVADAAKSIHAGKEKPVTKRAEKGNVVFEDDFSEGIGNWTVEQWDDKVKVECKDGKMRVKTQSKLQGVMIWCNKLFLPKDFIFEFDVTPLSESGFVLLFFCTQGPKGEDILTEKFFKKPANTEGWENCLFYKYVKTNINGYHSSYRRNRSATCNFRKHAGHHLMARQKFKELIEKNKAHHVTLYKKGGHIKLTVGGLVVMDYTDDGTKGGAVVWTGGRIGFRQVYDSDGMYDNIKLTELKQEGNKDEE